MHFSLKEKNRKQISGQIIFLKLLNYNLSEVLVVGLCSVGGGMSLFGEGRTVERAGNKIRVRSEVTCFKGWI